MDMGFNAQIINKTKEDVVNYLKNIADEYDDDFNGDNGEDYLWDEAKWKGYSNNADYCINEVMEQFEKDNDLVKSIKNFFKLWLCSDDYYDSYKISVIENYDNLYIAFAFMGSFK